MGSSGGLNTLVTVAAFTSKTDFSQLIALFYAPNDGASNIDSLYCISQQHLQRAKELVAILSQVMPCSAA
jgi:hypothetical protein